MAVVEFIGDDSKRFAELMKCFFAGDYRLTQRAAWPMNYCAERHPKLILPYLPKLLACLDREDMHVAVKRNVMRLLQTIEIPKRLTGKAYSHAVDLLDDADEPVGVRCFAMTVAARIAKAEPDLLHSTAAFKVRARDILS